MGPQQRLRLHPGEVLLLLQTHYQTAGDPCHAALVGGPPQPKGQLVQGHAAALEGRLLHLSLAHCGRPQFNAQGHTLSRQEVWLAATRSGQPPRRWSAATPRRGLSLDGQLKSRQTLTEKPGQIDTLRKPMIRAF